ncbi:MAG: recombinase family protein [Steroidobacteraceae bacterium]|nr:recombinase family protein [Deltaproteobacteria bacterium]
MSERTGRVLGYRRVSSLDQNTARQLEGVALDLEFEDKVSGKSMERPKLQELMRTAYTGDLVIVHSMDRLARNLIDLKNIVSELVASGAQVQFLKENLTFSGKADPYSELMLNLMGSFAEFERQLIKSRQAEGIAIKKAAGGYAGKGRKKSITDEKIAEIKRRVEAGEKKTKIASDLGISRESIYKLMK